MQQAQIYIGGDHKVCVGDFNTLDELTSLAGKFSGVVDADALGSVARLATATGDLSASVMKGDDEEGFAREIAGVVMSALTIGAVEGVRPEVLKAAIVSLVGEEIKKELASVMTDVLEARGMTNLLK